VWSGALIGAIIGFSRYSSRAGDSDMVPILSIPLKVGPYVLAGMLLGIS
jgi:hypothetical protein